MYEKPCQTSMMKPFYLTKCSIIYVCQDLNTRLLLILLSLLSSPKSEVSQPHSKHYEQHSKHWEEKPNLLFIIRIHKKFSVQLLLSLSHVKHT